MVSIPMCVFHDLKLGVWSYRWRFGFLWEYNKSLVIKLCFPPQDQLQWLENLARMLSSLPSTLSCANFWQVFMNMCYVIQNLNVCDYLQLFTSYSLERSYQVRSLFQLIKLLDITHYFILYIMSHCFTNTLLMLSTQGLYPSNWSLFQSSRVLFSPLEFLTMHIEC
jgi:hypothetical protein